MDFQFITVVFLVAGSFAYAAWALMPRALRQGLLVAVGKTPLRALFGGRLLRVDAGAAGACGSCGNCSQAMPKPASQPGGKPPEPQVSPLHFVPMAKRR